MQVVLVLEQRRDLVLVTRRDQPRHRKFLFEILDDVVALDVHGAVIDQHRHQPARIDAEEPRLHVLVVRQIDRMRLPRNTLEIEEDAKLLRARRAHEVQHVDALPAEHLARLDVAIDKLNHGSLSRRTRRHHRRVACSRNASAAMRCASLAAGMPQYNVSSNSTSWISSGLQPFFSAPRRCTPSSF